jgi:hypothetical protein
MMQKTPRQIQSARERRARAASSGDGSKSPLSVATGRRGLDPMDIARGRTRPTATPPAPLFLPLSPRKFDGFAGTHLEQRTGEMKRRGRDSTTSSKAAGTYSREPSSDNANYISSAWLESAVDSTANGRGDGDGSGSVAPPFSPPPSSDYGLLQKKGSRSSPRPAVTTVTDLRCYSPASKFIALSV